MLTIRRALCLPLCLLAGSLSAQHGGPMTVSDRPMTADQVRSDLQLFRTEFLAADRSYSPSARAVAESLVARLSAGADTLTRIQFELALSQVVALADNGHSMIPAAMRSARYDRVPLRLVPFGDKFYVLATTATNADLLGAQLLAIDGRPMEALRERARTLSGGTAAWRDRFVPFLLESPEQMHALGLAAGAGAATYELELPNGRRVTRRLVAERAELTSRMAGSGRWMYPAAAPGDSGRWRTLLPAARTPWALQEFGTPFRWRRDAQLDALVIELRQVVDAAGHPIGAFLAAMENELRTHPVRHVVLDLRMNGGGNLQTARDFAARLPSLVPGRIFVLTSPWTFSAAISTTGYVKQAAPDRVTIVGEEVGDRMMFWAEGPPIVLPQSGIMIGAGRERHDYAGGCREYTDCHGPVVRVPITLPTLAPDLPAPWTVEAYREGRDPAMEAVAKALRPAVP